MSFILKRHKKVFYFIVTYIHFENDFHLCNNNYIFYIFFPKKAYKKVFYQNLLYFNNQHQQAKLFIPYLPY